MPCQIRLNGRSEQLSDDVRTVHQLLAVKGVNPARVAVELNRRILPRNQFESTSLSAGDVVEVVTFVGGG
ncbi:MAG TPA: sulfur carrier protein ThiS [Chloroflexota bacterium]|nr:sulfur carrier protein ThiS [Chloroflexota bacterium]